MWYEKLGGFLKQGMIGSDGKTNWAGVAAGAGLAGIGAVFASTFGAIPAILATLALGGFGLGVGAMIDRKVNEDTDIATDVGKQEMARSVSIDHEIIAGQDLAKTESLENAMAMSGKIKKTGTSRTYLATDKQQEFDHQVIIAQTDEARDAAEKKSSHYQAYTYKLIEAAEATQTQLDKPTRAIDKLKAELLALQGDDKTMRGLIASQNPNADLDNASLEELHEMARDALVRKARAMYDRKRDTQLGEDTTWDSRAEQVEQAVEHALDTYKDGDAAGLNRITRSGTGDWLQTASQPFAELQQEEGLDPDIQTRVSEVIELNDVSQLDMAYRTHQKEAVGVLRDILKANIPEIETKRQKLKIQEAAEEATQPSQRSAPEAQPKDLLAGLSVTPTQTPASAAPPAASQSQSAP